MVAEQKLRRGQRARDVPGSPPHRTKSVSGQARINGDRCQRCNKEHLDYTGKAGCNGHKRGVRPYTPCQRPPIRGARVCERHGGKNPVVQELAKRRIAYAEGEGEVAALLRQMDLPEQHPIEGLLEVVRHSGGMFRLLGFLCAKLKLEPGEIGIAVNEETGDVTKYTKDDALHGYDHKSDQAPHVLLVLYKQWAETYARACKLALDANIDERLVRNAEHTSHAMFTAVTRAIAESDMDAETATRFSKALAGQLRALMDPFADVGGSNGQGQQEARQASARNRQGIEAARPRKKVRRTKRHTEA